MKTMAEHLRQAWNSHDIALLMTLFADDYISEQPAHPGRAFTGSAQVLANWTGVFDGVPDFTAVLVASSVTGDTEWAEWQWRGRHPDGSSFAMCGVTILELRDGRIARGRLYLEPVDAAPNDIDSAVRELYRPPGAD